MCEQAHQQLKGELGLGHFEGRSWTGLHRHALMCCVAFAYLQHLRLAKDRRTRRGENAGQPSGTASITEPARRAPRHHRHAICPAHAARPVPAMQEAVQATTQYESAQVVLVAVTTRSSPPLPAVPASPKAPALRSTS